MMLLVQFRRQLADPDHAPFAHGSLPETRHANQGALDLG
jgi:hypothetical protein